MLRSESFCVRNSTAELEVSHFFEIELLLFSQLDFRLFLSKDVKFIQLFSVTYLYNSQIIVDSLVFRSINETIDIIKII